MNIPKNAPSQLYLEREGDQVLLHLVVDRGWRFWLPHHVTVPMEQSDLIWLYQTAHKFMGRPHEEAPINIAAALVELKAIYNLLAHVDQTSPVMGELADHAGRAAGYLGRRVE